MIYTIIDQEFAGHGLRLCCAVLADSTFINWSHSHHWHLIGVRVTGSCASHFLAGLPGLFFVALAEIRQRKQRKHTIGLMCLLESEREREKWRNHSPEKIAMPQSLLLRYSLGILCIHTTTQCDFQDARWDSQHKVSHVESSHLNLHITCWPLT